jgi:hypothetical protein
MYMYRCIGASRNERENNPARTTTKVPFQTTKEKKEKNV